MSLDVPVTLAGLFVGFVVGLTGMGGGALMTPLLVLFFGFQPLTAVSSDLVASLIMKPVGGVVHSKRGTVHWRLVAWLGLGSVPAAFLGVLLLRSHYAAAELQHLVKHALGVTLLAVVAALLLRSLISRKRASGQGSAPLEVRPVPTVLIGVLGGLVVGVTSVGAGSLMIILLLLVYPKIRLSELVGTDLVQAIPLILSASIGHLLFGAFSFDLTTSIVLGGIPGVYLGARCSAHAPDAIIRPALAIVLVASALKLLGAGNLLVALVTGSMLLAAVASSLINAQRARARELPMPGGE